MADNKFHIEQFNQETNNWEAYHERLELYFIANGVEEQKVVVLLTVAGPKTNSLVRSLYSSLIKNKPVTKQAIITVSVTEGLGSWTCITLCGS